MIDNRDEKYIGLIYAYFYKMTGKEIANILDKKHVYKEEDLPRYSFNDRKEIVRSDCWFQFVEPDKKTYILFDIVTCDYTFQDNLFDYFDDYFISEKNKIDQDNIIINEWNTRKIPYPTYFKITLRWNYDYWGEYDDSIEIVLWKGLENE